MPHVQVSIAGRAYRMACGAGEEAHLTGLAERFDAKIADMRAAFGEIGDMRLHVMAALTLADEAQEGGGGVAALQADVDALRAEMAAASERTRAAESACADALRAAAERMDQVANAVAAAPPARR